MKILNILLFSLCLLNVCSAQRQISHLSLDNDAKKYLYERSKMFKEDASYRLFKIDYEAFFEENFSLSFDNHLSTINFQKQKLIKRKNGIISWFGNTLAPTQFSQFVINPKTKTVRGIFFMDGYQYFLFPLSGDFHVVIKSASYKQTKCGDLTTLNSSEKIENRLNQYSRAIHCAQRVLFAYTPKAKIADPDVKGLVQMEVDVTNLSYLNAGVDNLIEVAIIYETDYDESYTEETCWNDGLALSKTTDLCRFQDEDDDHMDEVHGLRDMYHADMCVLLVDGLISGVGGQAYDVGASEEDEAFCVAVITNFSTTIAHELGHLQGCHHDRYVLDGILTPSHYGYVNWTHSQPFITVMAYEDECVDNNVTCPVANIFSTPDEDWNGVPAGEEHNPPFDSGHDNAGQIMDTKTLVSNFRSLPINLDVSTLFEFKDQDYVYATALTNIENKLFLQPWAYKIGNGAVVHWRTEQNIKILPGFHAKAGSTFEAKISTTCEQPPY